MKPAPSPLVTVTERNRPSERTLAAGVEELLRERRAREARERAEAEQEVAAIAYAPAPVGVAVRGDRE
jgi:hypothetical protein